MVDLIERIAFCTGVDIDDVKKICGKTKVNYSFYLYRAIPKNNHSGLYRLIVIPAPAVKLVQHYLVDTYFSKIHASDYAYAYVKGKSVVDNASQHCNNNHFFFSDVHDFFGSLNYDRIKEVLLSESVFSGENGKDIDLILTACTDNKRFVQGAVSTPCLSNIYMRNFDAKMNELASKLKNGVYTRYSDDIVISAQERIPLKYKELVREELKALGLFMNQKKTFFSSNPQRISVTGVRVMDGTTFLNSSFKKDLKNAIYHFLKQGSNCTDNEITGEQLLGKMSYLKMVDPGYYNTIQLKYRKKTLLTTDRIKKILAKNMGVNLTSTLESSK